MTSIGTGWHEQCVFCKKRIKGVSYCICKSCRTSKTPEEIKAKLDELKAKYLLSLETKS